MKKILITISLVLMTFIMASCKVSEDPTSLYVLKDEQVKQKVNVYFFWRDGCPYCAEAKNVFAEIKREYGNCYNLVDLNIWDQEKPENMEMFTKAADHFKIAEDDRGVPFIIINGQQFGFQKEVLIDEISKLCQSDEYEDTFEEIIK